MAHIQQLLFVKNIVQVLGVQNVENVVEIGSWDVNGSVRTEFPKSNYLGLDVSEGKGVDRVYDGKDLSFLQSNSVEVVISCECFEHNPHWRDNLHDMIRICKPGGFIIATMASRGRPEHGTTRSRSGSSISTSIGWDYYHNITRKEFIRALQTEPLHRHYVAYNPYSKDLYAVLWKKMEALPQKKIVSMLLKKLLELPISRNSKAMNFKTP